MNYNRYNTVWFSNDHVYNLKFLHGSIVRMWHEYWSIVMCTHIAMIRWRVRRVGEKEKGSKRDRESDNLQRESGNSIQIRWRLGQTFLIL